MDLPDLQNFDFAIVLTAAGATVAAALIASAIQMAKKLPTIGPWIDAKREPGVAVVLAGLLVAYSYFVTTPVIDAVNAGGAFIAFLGVAKLATAAYDVAVSVKTSVSSSSG